MKASAQAICQQTHFDSSGTPERPGVMPKGFALRDITGAAALLYVLEPAKKAEYKAAIGQWDDYLSDLKSGVDAAPNKWLFKVPSSSVFFNSVLALDVIYPDLTPAERQQLEGSLAPVAEWFWASTSSWDLADYGVRGIWALYTNDTARKQVALKQYRDRLFGYFTTDGVYTGGTEYPHGRLGGERTAKVGFMHVAEFTGADPVYYQSPTLQRFYEWLYTFTLNPFNQIVTFGDAGHGRYFETQLPVSAAFGTTNFSDRAGALVAYRMSLPHQPNPPGDLLSYCITRKPLPSPAPPQSQVWRDGGAVFWEQNPTAQALMGALYNASGDGGHLHKEANAIYVAGYGETLLANSGYNGYGNGNGFGGFDFKYIENNAESGNTITTNAENHRMPQGDGVSESLIEPGFNYVSASADRALKGAAQHQRNFFFIPPQDGQNGYLALLDEVRTAQPAQAVALQLHPMADHARTTQPAGQFTWSIRRQKPTPTYLTVFLGTPPDSGTVLKKGLLAGWKASFVGEYLQASYRSDATAKKRLVTVLFPHDSTHALANLQRLTGKHYSGVQVSLAGNTRDVVLESTGRALAVVGKTSFQALGTLYREKGKQLQFYFVRKGANFLRTDRVKTGFTSDKPISV